MAAWKAARCWQLNDNPPLISSHPPDLGGETTVYSLSFKRARYPLDDFRYAICACFRFAVGFRYVKDLPAERGVSVSNESIRRWALKFAPPYRVESGASQTPAYGARAYRRGDREDQRRAHVRVARH